MNKKIQIAAAIAAVMLATGAQAQLRVSPIGKVLVGAGAATGVDPLSTFTVEGNGTSGYAMSVTPYSSDALMINCASGKGGIRISTQDDGSTTRPGLEIYPNAIASSSAKSISLTSYSGASNNGTTFGIAGHYFDISGYKAKRAAGIYGSSSTSSEIYHDGLFAGYFNGDVRVTGSLYATLLSPTSTSGSITALTANAASRAGITTQLVDESVSDKLGQVQLLQMTTARQTKAKAKKAYTVSYPTDSDAAPLTPEEFDRLIAEHQDDEPIQTELASTRYGLAADQLKRVYPELVYEDADGNVSINYIEMIPLLVQAVNELKSENTLLRSDIAALQGDAQVSSKTKTRAAKAADAASIETADEAILSLAQNRPNPFSESTTIDLCVPDGVQTAALFIYDMGGKQVAKIDIAERGKTQLSVTSAGLAEGMYLYSLIADGQVAGTRKMIITK